MGEDERIVNFDQFGCVDIAGFQDAKYFMRCDDKEGLQYLDYEFSNPLADFQTLDLFGDKYALFARANRFAVDEVTNETRTPGHLFNGVLWVQPKMAGVEDYGMGGRIFCWESDIEDLSSLILNGAVSESEFDERFNAIRDAYIDNEKRKKEAQRDSIYDSFRRGEGSGRWRSRHGYS